MLARPGTQRCGDCGTIPGAEKSWFHYDMADSGSDGRSDTGILELLQESPSHFRARKAQAAPPGWAASNRIGPEAGCVSVAVCRPTAAVTAFR